MTEEESSIYLSKENEKKLIKLLSKWHFRMYEGAQPMMDPGDYESPVIRAVPSADTIVKIVKMLDALENIEQNPKGVS